MNQDETTILRARARALAREPEPEPASAEHLPVIEFVLAYERYAIESASVREVIPLRDLTPLPCTPDFVLGIINVRGQILAVLDLKRFFDLPQKGLTDLNKVLIVRSGETELGFLADAILGVHSLPLHAIQPALATMTGIRAEYVRGVTPDRRIVLDVATILADRGILVDEEGET